MTGPSSAMMSTKAEEIGRVLSEPVVDLWKLRELALTEGGLVNDALRKLAWPKLVGINPDLNTLPGTAIQAPPTSKISIPPSLDSEQIERDVSRVTWHLLTGNQRSRNFQMKNKHRKRIGTLLKKKQRRLGDFLNLSLVQSYGEDDREADRLRYYQGYHDIASIFLSALGGATSVQTTLSAVDGGSEAQVKMTDLQEAHTAATSMGLTLACQVLNQVSRSHYRDAMRSNFNQLNAALRLIIMPLTAAFDAQVHSHLFDCEMEPFFALSWIITWFSHDVRDTSLVKRLFDFFISSHPLMSIYMSVAMMIHPLNRIEILGADCDFACVHNVLADLPKNSSNVGWKYIPGDGGSSGYVSGDEDDASAASGSLFDQSCDEPEEEGSQISSSVLNNPRNARVPFQELIDLSISLMHKIPPRNLINLAQRYHNRIALQPLMAEASTIALLQPPPSRCLASYADSDWVLKQKLREEHGLKLNRHQRKNRFKLVNTDVEYHGDDEVTSSKLPSKVLAKLASKAIIASGTGPDGRAEERKVRKRRRMMIRSVAVVLLSVFAAMAKTYFSPPTGDDSHGTPQRTAEIRTVLEKGAPMLDVAGENKACIEGTCAETDKPSVDAPYERNAVEKSEVKEPKKKQVEEEVQKSLAEEEATVCDNDEVSEVEKPEPVAINFEEVSFSDEAEVSIVQDYQHQQPEEPQTNKVLMIEKEKKSRPPTTEPVPLLEFADQFLTLFHNFEPYLEAFLIHAVNIIHLGWRHTGRAFSKIVPVAHKGLVMELEDDSSSLENVAHVAQETWKRRGDMYQKQLKKVAKVTTEVVRKGARSTQGLANDLNKEMARKILKRART